MRLGRPRVLLSLLALALPLQYVDASPMLPKRVTQADLRTAQADVTTHVTAIRQKLAARAPHTPGTAFSLLDTTYNNTALFPILNTVVVTDVGETFLTTGLSLDKQYGNMWLRDAAIQLHFFLSSGLVSSSPAVAALFESAVRVQARMILMDGYANSFTRKPFASSDRRMGRGGYVGTRNYELDSVQWFIRLAHEYYTLTGRTDWVDGVLYAAVEKVVIQIQLEQQHAFSTYNYVQTDPPGPLPDGGKGSPVGTTGMSWTGFRPSDDEAKFGYNLPDNMMAQGTLTQAAVLAMELFNDTNLASLALNLSSTIKTGITKFGTASTTVNGSTTQHFLTELDGLGNATFFDDANYPSLTSLSFINYTRPGDDLWGVYLSTRSMALSHANPYYYEGPCGAGLGSPHETTPGKIWPLGLIIQGLTAQSSEEALRVLSTLITTTCGQGLMHEGFSPSNACDYTREYFALPNALFAMFVESLLGSDAVPVVSPSEWTAFLGKNLTECSSPSLSF